MLKIAKNVEKINDFHWFLYILKPKGGPENRGDPRARRSGLLFILKETQSNFNQLEAAFRQPRQRRQFPIRPVIHTKSIPMQLQSAGSCFPSTGKPSIFVMAEVSIAKWPPPTFSNLQTANHFVMAGLSVAKWPPPRSQLIFRP